MSHHGDHDEREYHEKVLDLLRDLRHILLTIENRLPVREPEALKITQLGDQMPTNNSIVVGTSGVFQVTPLPAGSAFASGVLPQWAASDPSISLKPSTDGTQVTAAVPAGSTLPNFNLQASYVRQTDGTTITAVVTVTITAAAVAEPTSLSIAQLS